MTKNIYDLTVLIYWFDPNKKRQTAEERFCSRYKEPAAIEVNETNFHRLKTKKYAKYNIRIEKVLKFKAVGTWEERKV